VQQALLSTPSVRRRDWAILSVVPDRWKEAQTKKKHGLVRHREVRSGATLVAIGLSTVMTSQ